jgi:hypothetical protein
MRKVQVKNSGLSYFVSGDKPRLLIQAGTHGDEYEVTECVLKAMRKYRDVLPPFIFVPIVSPSAVAKKTRANGLGHDMNRSFFSDSGDPEVEQNLKIIQDGRFDLFVSFHEDPTQNQYYVYDIAYHDRPNELVMKHNQRLKSQGICLLNGVDDPDDPDLGYLFTDGYNKLAFPTGHPDNGSISSWVFNRQITKEYLLPEIPGRVDLDVKHFIVETFFSEVILEMFKC